jgi:hypothetical protein
MDDHHKGEREKGKEPHVGAIDVVARRVVRSRNFEQPRVKQRQQFCIAAETIGSQRKLVGSTSLHSMPPQQKHGARI